MDRMMTRKIAAGALALSLLAGGGVLAGCGSSSSSSETAAQAAANPPDMPANGIEALPAKEILAKSLTAAKAASSVTVKGTIAEEGEVGVSLDLVLGTDASKGTMSLNGFSMEIRVTGGKTYYKIDPEGVAAVLGPGEASAVIGDKWILVSPEDGDDPAGLSDFADKDALLTSLLASEGTATVKGTGDVNGTPVVFVEVKGSDGNATLAIQTVGEPYPVQLTNGESKGAITFSNWNAPVSVTAPAGAVRPDELTGKGGASG